MIGIGIDTGGTYTDAVVFDFDTREVLAKCKRLTTKEDLAVGIGNALEALPRELVERGELIALSTTLATNACVEGKGGRAKLVLAGSTEDVLHRIDAPNTYGLPYDSVLAFESRSSFDGEEVDKPDWDNILAENADFFADADAIGIAARNALRNGSAVERGGAEFFASKFNVPVIMASNLATAVNVMERGATVLLNAKLLPVLEEFIEAIDAAIKKVGLDIPIMLVRSDGTLMSMESAQMFPVVTILSGPAASISGSQGLASSSDCLIVDMGGTTTDVAIIENNVPVTTDGIRIGPWRTQVNGVYIDTIGLGGDSRVTLDNSGHPHLSSRRVLPLCTAASRWPQIKKKLKALVEEGIFSFENMHEFLYLVRRPSREESYTEDELALIKLCEDEPVSLASRDMQRLLKASERLEDEGVLMRCGMTPTDAMHIKGDFSEYDVEASRLAARYMLAGARKLRHRMYGAAPGIIERYTEALAEEIYDAVEYRLYRQIMRICFERSSNDFSGEEIDEYLDAVTKLGWRKWRRGLNAISIDQVAREKKHGGPEDVADDDGVVRNLDGLMHYANEEDIKAQRSDSIKLSLTIEPTLVGVGAPTGMFLPAVAQALGTDCVIPDNAEVANAVGAVFADISATAKATVTTKRGDYGVVLGYYLYSTERSELFESLEDAIAEAEKEAERLARAEALRRGAVGDIEVEVTQEHDMLATADGGETVYAWNYIARTHTRR